MKLKITRRDALILGGMAAAGATAPTPSRAVPGQMEAAIRKVIGDAKVQKGKVTLDLPPLVENGNVVSVSVSVDSPMTATDHVKAIHIFNEKNPLPDVLGVRLGPRAGRASFSTRIRLADTQTITAIAEVSDGTFWSASVEVIVTLAACVEVL
jgi:sulfur-oxidizing protein SoxY